MGELAEAGLRDLLKTAVALETQRRAQRLLEGIPLSPQRLQVLRAVEVLEYIATREAQGVLRKLSQGAIQAQVTRDAGAALERLRRR